MYLEKIRIENFRTFDKAEITLLHPDQSNAQRAGIFKSAKIIAHPNVNVILGNNGAGKSAMLRAVALACLGPTVRDSGIYPYRLVRRQPSDDNPRAIKRKVASGSELALPGTALIRADFAAHPQDRVEGEQRLVSSIRIDRKEDLETVQFLSRSRPVGWDAIYSDRADAFFFVGYGATRRTEAREKADPSGRRRARSARAARILGLFDDDTSLMPLSAWLPAFKAKNPGRYKQVANLLQQMTSDDYYRFTGEMEDHEYVFRLGKQTVPFPALSDGYRAFFGWIGDMLYHVCMGAPTGAKLVDCKGIVMIDEVDLHLHPRWQMEVLPVLSRALPNIQFIVTTHSPLIVGSVQRVNLLVLRVDDRSQSSTLHREDVGVHGLDADQVLTTPYFDLESTRAGDRGRQLKDLSNLAARGDRNAAARLLAEMSRGAEDTMVRTPVSVPMTKAVKRAVKAKARANKATARAGKTDARKVKAETRIAQRTPGRGKAPVAKRVKARVAKK